MMTRGGGAFPQRWISDEDKINIYIYIFLSSIKPISSTKNIIEKFIFLKGIRIKVDSTAIILILFMLPNYTLIRGGKKHIH